MPNWIEGTLKLRGKTNDMRRFFKTAIQPCACFGKEPYKQEDFIEFDFNEEWNVVHIKEDAYIEGTQRAFINNDCYAEFEDDEDTVCVPIRQAWAFVPKNWQDISKKFNLDIRLYGFERGMEFCQEVEVIDGEITIDREIKYDDWEWECPMPILGG